MSGAARLAALLGTWGRPVDRPATWALAVALVLAILALSPRALHAWIGVHPGPVPREVARRAAVVLGFVAAFLSLGYVAFYLRGAPRIIDATSYFLEGRVLSHGHLSWPVPSPSASFRGRFLLYRDGGGMAVIFPPGFPLLLAGGFVLGAPLVVGPALGFALVIATYTLAEELSRGFDVDARAVALLAAAVSVVSAALRYHTADTMAHAASALGVTVALVAALRARRLGGRGLWLLAGLAVGWVVCTRPVSSLAVGVVVVALTSSRRALGAVLLGVLPGALFLLVASHAQTGHWFRSAQAAYYASSDGPAGCFRYGFGEGVGCRFEHKDFVLARLPHGFGFVEALLTTLRRLRIHLLDVANLEPLTAMVVVPLVRVRGGVARVGAPSRVAVRAASLLVAGQVLAYVPFYFDGDYPGGGARFFADVLPVEHALLALGVAMLKPHIPMLRRSLGLVALSLHGFAIHGAFEHHALAERDGGRPMYDAEEGREAVKGRGLLFFDTDHGFNLAYDPYESPSRSILAARLRGDDHDRILVERMDRPPAHVYRRDRERASVVAWAARAGASKDLWRFEAEADWPPLSQDGGWAEPTWASSTCASEGRALTVHVEPGRTARVRIELPVPRTGRWGVVPRVLRLGGPGHGVLRLVRHGPGVPGEVPVWEWNDADGDASAGKPTCADVEARAGPVDLDFSGAEWELTATGGDVSLDATTLRAGR